MSEKLINTELDKILGKAYSVLDKGFVRVVDYMGDDSAIVQAARVSYGKGTKHISEDESLIRYLIRHGHTSPLEMCSIKLHIKVPMDCWRQWIRHRTAKVNEYSTRYSIAIDDKQETAPDKWRLQSKDNKQGSTTGEIKYPEDYDIKHIKAEEYLSNQEAEFHKQARNLYDERLKFGVAKEQARKDLPLSTYTEAYWKIDLHNLLHFLSLRMDSHAQLEIRSYANVIGNIVQKWVPLTWNAFNDYNVRRNALLLSARDIEVINAMGRFSVQEAVNIAQKFGWLVCDKEGKLKPIGERIEFEQKAAKLGLPIPWFDDKLDYLVLSDKEIKKINQKDFSAFENEEKTKNFFKKLEILNISRGYEE